MTGTTYVRSEARAAENDDHRDFFTMVVRLNLKFPGRGQRETPVEILQKSAGWERLRFTGVVELWCCWALGRRFGLQRRLRWRAATSTAYRNTERAQTCVGQHVVWQIWAYDSKLP